MIDDLTIIPDDLASSNDPQSIPLFDLETSRLNPIKEQVTLIQDLNEKLRSLSFKINALKSFVLEQFFVTKKTIQDIRECPNNKETNNGYLTSLTGQISFLKEENKTKNTVIQILSENQNYFSKQSEKQEFIFPKKVSQGKNKSKIWLLQIVFEYFWFATTLLDHKLTKTIVHQKRDNIITQKHRKKSDKPIKIYQKGIAIAAENSIGKRRWKIKKIRKSRDVTIILGDSIIKDAKAWELTDESNKVVVKSFRGATKTKHLKPSTEQNPENIILHCGTNDRNDDSDPQNIAEEIAELAK